MSTNFNAASRAHAILTDAVRQNNNAATLHVWATVFGIPSDNPIARMFEIARMVDQLYKQLEQVRREMSGQRIAPEKYNPVIDRLQSALNLDAPGNAWENYKQHLHAYTLDTLAQYADLLESEDEPIPEEELNVLSQLIDELEDQIRNGKLSSESRFFIERHISILRDALRLYRVVGNSAFTEAVTQAAAIVALNQEVIRKNSDNPEFQTAIQQLGKAWSTIKHYSPDVQTVLALIQGGQLLVEGGKIVIGLLTGG